MCFSIEGVKEQHHLGVWVGVDGQGVGTICQPVVSRVRQGSRWAFNQPNVLSRLELLAVPPAA
ncbi:hypothetical protein E2C01_043088 [Portunus trituberculatus]|uniref:Uncharacterized protein n=1 Tax=Portunus trituberculatus TaxID=210409 RepID=A0A5B7FNI5_PORTR|nr:hypothetical protein [Portunus trituberculatus]